MIDSRKVVLRRSIIAGSATAIAAPAIIGSALAQEKVTWKVQSHWPKASGSFNDSLGVLAKMLETRTGGRFKLELFGAGEIAKDREIYNVVRRGVVPMGTISPAYILGEAQAMGLFYGVPGTLRETWEMMQLTKNLGIEKMVNDELRPKGVVIKGEKAYPTEVVLGRRSSRQPTWARSRSGRREPCSNISPRQALRRSRSRGRRSTRPFRPAWSTVRTGAQP